MDAWKLIRSDHANIREIIREIVGAIGREGVKTRDRLFPELARELALLWDVRESVLYPALGRHRATRPYVAELRRAQRDIQRRMDELAGMPDKDGREWTRRFEGVAHAVERAFSQEEHGLLVVGRGALTPKQAEALGRALARERLAVLTAQRLNLPVALVPIRYGLSLGTVLGALAGAAALAAAAAVWRSRSRRPFALDTDETDRFANWETKHRSQRNRAARERHPTWTM